MQIDGEPWEQHPADIIITHHNQVRTSLKPLIEHENKSCLGLILYFKCYKFSPEKTVLHNGSFIMLYHRTRFINYAQVALVPIVTGMQKLILQFI
jgi:hypothetical protein